MSGGVLGLIGVGAVGPVLVRRLREAGWTIGTVAGRRIEAARAAVAFIGAGEASDDILAAGRDADLLLLAVPDRAIAGVGAALAAGRVLRPEALVLHVSGALSSEVLAPLRAGGASVGSLHPLQSFASDPESALERLRDTWLFLEGDEPGRIRGVAEDLGGHPVALDPAGKVLYHAGAAAACNLAVAAIDLGLRLLAAAGISHEDGLAALLPLLRGTVENLARVGLPDALTGPVARGDADTVAGHLEAVAAHSPELLPPYVELSRHAIRIGLAKGSLTAEQAERLRGILAATPRASS